MSIVNEATQPLAAVPTPTQPWKRPKSAQRKDLIFTAAVALVAAIFVLITGFAGVDGWLFASFLLVLGITLVRGRKLIAKERRNNVASLLIASAALAAFIPWMSIFVSVLIKGAEGLRPNFLYSDMRTTTPDDVLSMGGAGHAILGSLIMVVIATLITLPLGILSGVYLTEVRGRFANMVRFVIQSMSGVPSIVAACSFTPRMSMQRTRLAHSLVRLLWVF